MPTILFHAHFPTQSEAVSECRGPQSRSTEHLSSLSTGSPPFNCACSRGKGSMAQTDLLPEGSPCHKPPGPAVKLSAPRTVPPDKRPAYREGKHKPVKRKELRKSLILTRTIIYSNVPPKPKFLTGHLT